MKSAPGLRSLYPRPERRGFTPLLVNALAGGNPAPLVERVSDILANGCGTRSYLNIEEKDFHWALLVGANFASGYDVFVEHEVRGADKGFIDLLMVSHTAAPSYLFEVKYLKKNQPPPPPLCKTNYRKPGRRPTAMPQALIFGRFRT